MDIMINVIFTIAFKSNILKFYLKKLYFSVSSFHLLMKYDKLLLIYQEQILDLVEIH